MGYSCALPVYAYDNGVRGGCLCVEKTRQWLAWKEGF
jgi:hypothetical protein